MKHNYQGTIKLIVVLVLGLVVLAVLSGTLLPVSFLNSISQKPTPTSHPTAKWKTYTNQQLGFKVKLPLDIDVINQDHISVELGTFPPNPEPCLIFTKKLGNYSEYQSTQTTINNFVFKRYVTKKEPSEHVILQSQELQFEIQWKPDFKEEYPFLDSILSTFQFLD